MRLAKNEFKEEEGVLKVITNDIQAFNHPVLGKLEFDNRAVYDKDKIAAVFLKGIEHLGNKNLITTEDKNKLEQILALYKVEKVDNLGYLMSSKFEHDIISGNVYPHICFDSSIQYLRTERIVEALLDMLCQIIVSVLHTEEVLKKQTENIEEKGELWAKYASALLSERKVMEELLYEKLYRKALDEIPKYATNKQKELLQREFKNNWLEGSAEAYANDVLDNLDSIEEYYKGKYMTIQDFLENVEYDYGS